MDNDLTADELDGMLAKAEKSHALAVMKDGEKTIYIHGRDNDCLPMRLWITVEGLSRREVSDFIAACDPDTIRRLVELARRGLGCKGSACCPRCDLSFATCDPEGYQ